jgi:23S rRNA pseudouridine2605 synthase
VELVEVRQRLYCVGRLDEHSEGLIVLTNDGEFAQKLAHPRYGIRKTYLARVEGDLGEEVLEKIRKGMWLAEGRTQGAEVEVKKRAHGVSQALITLREGKNREVRRIFARLGHKVFTLRRIRIGTLSLGSLKPGSWRRLSHDEVRELLSEARSGGFAASPTAAPAFRPGVFARDGRRVVPRGGVRTSRRPGGAGPARAGRAKPKAAQKERRRR